MSIITNEPSATQVIANLHRRMTEAEYDVERAKINDAEGLRRLFQCCGWTQTRIAAKEGCAQSWVSRVVRGEKVRMRAPLHMHIRSMVPLMKLDKDPRRGLYVHKVTAAYADRHWHTPTEIAKQLGLQRQQVVDALKWIRASRALHLKIERKSIHQGWRTRSDRFEFKIIPITNTKMVSIDVLTEQLAPIIEALRVEGRKNMATIAPAQVAYLAARLKKLLDTWTE